MSISPFIAALYSSMEAVSEAVIEGILCVEETREGGVVSLVTDSCVSDNVRGNNEDAFALEVDFRRRVLYVGLLESLTEEENRLLDDLITIKQILKGRKEGRK